ncbi:MAG: flagellar basal body rod modification protein FlgD [Pirellulaceae bacterium]|nr:MAG: flagellar basal body rod modification protein FlgD [Pirellulaceae bacterium]
MEPITSAGTATTQNAAVSKPRQLKDLDMDQFLKLMITELQNQDPLNPMDNTQLIEQLGQIRQITATNQLVSSLQAVVMAQNLAAASSLIGKSVEALSDDNRTISGTVEQVQVEPLPDNQTGRTVRLKIGDALVRLENLRHIGS